MELLSCSVLHSFIHPVSVKITRVHRGSHGSWRPQHADSAGCLCEVSRLSLAVSLMWRRQNLPSLTSGEVLTAAPLVLHGVGPTFFHDDTQNVAAAAAASHADTNRPLLGLISAPLISSPVSFLQRGPLAGTFWLLQVRLWRSENTCIPTQGACEKTSCTQEVGTSCVTKT